MPAFTFRNHYDRPFPPLKGASAVRVHSRHRLYCCYWHCHQLRRIINLTTLQLRSTDDSSLPRLVSRRESGKEIQESTACMSIMHRKSY